MHGKLRFVADIGAFFVLILALGTGLDVIGRFFFNSPWGGTYEVTQIILLAIAALGVVSATAANENISVDILYSKLSSSGQRVLKFVAAIFGFVFFMALAWEGMTEFLKSWEIAEKTDMVGFPIYPFRLLLVMAFVICGMIMIYEMIHLQREKHERRAVEKKPPR
jgi:TRAP-type transport system small permease protein